MRGVSAEFPAGRRLGDVQTGGTLARFTAALPFSFFTYCRVRYKSMMD